MKKILDIVTILFLSLGYYVYCDKVFTFNYYIMLFIGYVFVAFYWILKTIGKQGISDISYNRKKVFLYVIVILLFVQLLSLGFYSVSPIIIRKFLSKFIFYSSIFVTAVAICGLYGKKSVDIVFWAAVLNYSTYIINYIVQNGLIELLKVIYYIFVDNNDKLLLLEAHEVTFSIGLLFCYYANEGIKKNLFKIILASCFIILGYKRILIGAIFVSFILVILIEKIFKNKIKPIALVVTLGCIIMSLLWVGLISENALSKIANIININLMGRDRIYSNYSEIYFLGINYIGRGLGYVSAYNEINNLNISMHSDILMLYIELGGVGFILINLLLIFKMSTNIYESSGYKKFKLYLIISMITVICCFTDNLLNYYNYLLVFNIILLVCFSAKKNAMKICNESEVNFCENN